jgi:hypothetical protein
MIAVDTNILVHAHRADSPWHDAAGQSLASLSGRHWALPWPCVHEFMAIVTHPRVFDPPTPLPEALATVDGWLTSRATLLAETTEHWTTVAALLRAGRVTGPAVHDARVAALCLEHAVDELWTADRDFARFPALRVRNPLVAG